MRHRIPDDLRCAPLMRRVHVGEQVADREGYGAGIAQLGDGAAYGALVERLDLGSGMVDPPADLPRAALRHQRRRAAELELELVALACLALDLLDRPESSVDQQADSGARVGPCNQAGEKGALEREVGRVVVQEQTSGDPGHQRQANRERENESVAPVATLEDQDVPELPESRQHGRQHRHHRDLHDERGQQQLVCGEKSGLFQHRANCTREG